MKRRTFLQTLAAAGVTIPVLSHSAPSDKVTESPSVELTRASRGIYKALITANSGQEANDIRVAMGRPNDIKVVGPGAALCGMGTEMLLLAHDPKSHFWDADSAPVLAERYRQWVNEALRTRLLPGGHEVQVHFQPEDYDLWMTGSFRDRTKKDPYCIYRARMHMGPGATYDQRIRAKAAMLQAYIHSPPLIDRSYT